VITQKPRKFLSQKKHCKDLIGLVVTILSANKRLWKNEAANLHGLKAIGAKIIHIAAQYRNES
jgi:hypothetical protein